MATPLRRALSHAVGWAADRKIPSFLRSGIYRGYARATGADLGEVRLALREFPSLAQFFVRELKPGARPIDATPDALVSPVDGTVQSLDPIVRGCVLQAKGRSYSVDELLAGLRGAIELEGGFAWTIYLSPRDYHRIHAPERSTLREIAWTAGCRHPVKPSVLARRRVLDVNERVVMRFDSSHGPYFHVLVGALNVGRMRVVGIEPTPRRAVEPPREYARGAELARFELGSTIVLVTPPGVAEPEPDLAPGTPVRLGSRVGRWLR
jgi:phosphatidylserine decarboxylase